MYYATPYQNLEGNFVIVNLEFRKLNEALLVVGAAPSVRLKFVGK